MTPIERLSATIEQLSIKAKKMDAKNAHAKIHRLIENSNLFSGSLFVTQSDRFSPYIEEIEQKLPKLARLLSEKKEDLSLLLLEQTQHQIIAISNALHSNSTLHQAAKLSVDAHNQIKSNKAKLQNRYKKVAEKMLLNSHQLYQKLNEHHEFERRLMDMVTARESERQKSNAKNSAKLSAEVLALHQRLGRCRKAISIIERDIELAEKRN